MRVTLKEPTLEEYWYEQKLLADPLTMEYNAGWDVSYEGYNYDTGCIEFPKEKWEKAFNRRKESNRYFAYVVNKENNEFIGKVNFQYNENDKIYYCGVIIEHQYRGQGYAKEALQLLCEKAFNEYNVPALYDNFEESRISALKTFEKLGFKRNSITKGKRFNKGVSIIEIRLEKESFNNYRNN